MPSAAPVAYLTLEDLLHLVRALGAGPVRDVGLLDSAVHRPQSSIFGADAYPTLELKAAALLHSIVRGHALVDGNKRLAWLAATVFLRINGRLVDVTPDAAFDAVMAAAVGDLDVEALAMRLVTGPVR